MNDWSCGSYNPRNSCHKSQQVVKNGARKFQFVSDFSDHSYDSIEVYEILYSNSLKNVGSWIQRTFGDVKFFATQFLSEQASLVRFNQRAFYRQELCSLSCWDHCGHCVSVGHFIQQLIKGWEHQIIKGTSHVRHYN